MVYFRATLHALLASRQHNSSPQQAAIANFAVQLTNRYIFPAALDPRSPEYDTLAQQLLQLAQPSALRASWRYSLMSNVLLLLLLPPPDSPLALPYVLHLLALLSHTSLTLRQLAAAGLFFQLSALLEGREEARPRNPALLQAVRERVAAPGFGATLLNHLAQSHSVLDEQEGSKDKRGGGLLAMQARLLNMTFEEMISKVLHASMDQHQRWPPADSPAGIKDGMFVVSHARLVLLLSTAAPSEMVAAMRPFLEAGLVPGKLQEMSNTSDKAEQAALAETMAGLLACGAYQQAAVAGGGCSSGGVGSGSSGFGSSSAAAAGGNGGSGWLLKCLALALRGTTLELSESWAVAMRFGVRGLLRGLVAPPPQATQGGSVPWSSRAASPLPSTLSRADALDALRLLLDMVLGKDGLGGADLPEAKAGAGEAGGALRELPTEVKRLKYMQQCVKELCGLDPAHQLPAQVLAFWGEALQQLQALLCADAFSLREPLAGVLVDVCSYFGGSSCSQEAVSAGGDEAGSSSMRALRQQAQALASGVGSDYIAAAAAIDALRPNPRAPSPPGGGASTPAAAEPGGDVAMADAAAAVAADAAAPLSSKQMSHLGVGLQFIFTASLSGDLIALRTLLLSMLPALLRLQELAGPQLQQLAREAQMAFVLVKYTPLTPAHTPAVIALLQVRACMCGCGCGGGGRNRSALRVPVVMQVRGGGELGEEGALSIAIRDDCHTAGGVREPGP